MSSNPPPVPRAPAIALKLEAAREVLRQLEQDVGKLALEAAEGQSGASKRLADLRATIATAQRDTGELERAHTLAERLDRDAVVAAAATMRAEQLVNFESFMTARQKAMAAVLTAAAAMAKAYGEYSEATLSASIAVPSGTRLPPMTIGTDGFAGPAFGPCERLILAELYRLAPDRADSVGRFVLPFAKPSTIAQTLQPEKIPPALDELTAGHRAILADIAQQIEQRNASERAAAGRVAA